MKRVERRALIGAPPAEVFAFLSDLDNLSEWQSGVTTATMAAERQMEAR